MKAFTEIPSARRALLHPRLEALAQAQGDAGRHVAIAVPVAVTLDVGTGGPGGRLLHVGEVDVVAGDPDLDPAVGQLGRHLGRHVRQQFEDP